jgi:hypothetical protein
VNGDSNTDVQDAELLALRARVDELERELVEQQRRTGRVVAESQEKLYWLERWGVDLNRLMRHRGAQQALSVVSRTRRVVWSLKRLIRRLRER